MITYEANAMCDFCESNERTITAIVCGEPDESAECAKEHAINEAKSEGWLYEDGKLKCRDCQDEAYAKDLSH